MQRVPKNKSAFLKEIKSTKKPLDYKTWILIAKTVKNTLVF